jgi:hypothetical protein
MKLVFFSCRSPCDANFLVVLIVSSKAGALRGVYWDRSFVHGLDGDWQVARINTLRCAVRLHRA